MSSEIPTLESYLKDEHHLDIKFKDFDSWLNKTMNNPKRHIYVAEDKGVICGVLILKKEDFRNKIRTLAISDSERYKGLGSLLLKTSIIYVLK